MHSGWNEALVQEQQDIMDRIKGARKGTQSPSVVEQSSAERPTADQPAVELSSSPSSHSFLSHAQTNEMSQQLAKERRERS
ncbi:hypothetical protein C0995_005267, partial [Termitomyces sp. Mi166